VVNLYEKENDVRDEKEGEYALTKLEMWLDDPAPTLFSGIAARMMQAMRVVNSAPARKYARWRKWSESQALRKSQRVPTR